MDRVFIIAEAGVNHNGDVNMAMQLVDVAVAAGADAVKFQTFRTDLVVTDSAPKAAYQMKMVPGSKQRQMLKDLELSPNNFATLSNYCCRQNIEFMSTPFDRPSLDLLVDDIKIKRIKIPSGEITNGPFLLHAASKGLPIIMSTGMSTLEDVKVALGVLAFGYISSSAAPQSINDFSAAYASPQGAAALKENVSLLHCTTQYPAPYDAVNLKAMDALRDNFQLPVGYSDHTLGISIAIGAAARGATIIEKHITLDRNLPGPDHSASLQREELFALVEGIRNIESAYGDGVKRPHAAEIENKAIARRSLVAFEHIRKGEIFTVNNLTAKRPGTGISPMKFWDYIGRPAKRDYRADDLINED